MASSSSSSTRGWKYDVFLSFRGPDTRKGITVDLYDRLSRSGIITFMDTFDLQAGDVICPTLIKAIKESRFAIVVLSQNYASSTWCLEELREICLSMEDNRILPLFYQVDPTDVRYQKMSFDEAFSKHGSSGRHELETVEQWRAALQKVANISGWSTNDFETHRKLVDVIAEYVRSKMPPDVIESTGDFQADEATRQAKRIDQKGEVQIQIDSEVPASPRVTVGLDMPLMELKTKFLWDDKVTMLVLTAPGGSGKTTLATKLCHDEAVKGKFKNNIFFFTLSKKLNFNLIVQGLHQRKSTEVPSFQDEATAVKWLHEFSKEEGQAPVLLVLDNVWSESEYILETFDEAKMPNFKILVTSRSHFSGYGSLYHLPLLNDIDAMKLLRHSASLGDGSFNVQWNSLAKKIVEHCKGYPLAIDVVGKSLRRKSYLLWSKREAELSKSDSVIELETEVLLRLKSSLTSLNEKEASIKECFLDLGSFPEGQRIPVVALIDMWAVLHEGLEKDVFAFANVHELTARSLADLVVTRKEMMEVDDYYSEHFVTQHDLLRQLAVYEAKLDTSKKRLIIGNSGDNLPKCLTQQKDQLIKPRLLSISSDETFFTDLHNIHLPDVEVLVLNFNTKNYSLPSFVEKMVNLKVLIITNYGFLPAELSNFHLLDSLPNLKRIRLERVSIPSITKNSIRLKSLEKISLFMCSIGQAFTNCSFDISDALPNLEELNIDYSNDLVGLPDTICNLVRLRKLSITNCHKLSALPKEIGKLEMLEVLRLRSCTDLVKLPCSIRNLGNLDFLDISNCFNIVELPEDIGDLSGLRKIYMRQCSKLKVLPRSVSDIQKIEEVICDEETKMLWEPEHFCQRIPQPKLALYVLVLKVFFHSINVA